MTRQAFLFFALFPLAACNEEPAPVSPWESLPCDVVEETVELQSDEMAIPGETRTARITRLTMSSVVAAAPANVTVRTPEPWKEEGFAYYGVGTEVVTETEGGTRVICSVVETVVFGIQTSDSYRAVEFEPEVYTFAEEVLVTP